MNNERVEFLNNLWMDTDFGKYILAHSEKRVNDAHKILDKLYNMGYSAPYSHLVEEDKKIVKLIERSTKSADERNEYIWFLIRNHPHLIDSLYQFGSAILDLGFDYGDITDEDYDVFLKSLEE